MYLKLYQRPCLRSQRTSGLRPSICKMSWSLLLDSSMPHRQTLFSFKLHVFPETSPLTDLFQRGKQSEHAEKVLRIKYENIRTRGDPTHYLTTHPQPPGPTFNRWEKQGLRDSNLLKAMWGISFRQAPPDTDAQSTLTLLLDDNPYDLQDQGSPVHSPWGSI